MSELIEPQVIQNSDFLAARPFPTIQDQPLQEITQYEREMLKGTKTPLQLLEEEKEHNVTISERQRQKNVVTMYKVVALDLMGKHPLTNTSTLYKKEKHMLLEKVKDLMAQFSEDEIKVFFNDVCTAKIFDQNTDYAVLPVYNNI